MIVIFFDRHPLSFAENSLQIRFGEIEFCGDVVQGQRGIERVFEDGRNIRYNLPFGDPFGRVFKAACSVGVSAEQGDQQNFDQIFDHLFSAENRIFGFRHIHQINIVQPVRKRAAPFENDLFQKPALVFVQREYFFAEKLHAFSFAGKGKDD